MTQFPASVNLGMAFSVSADKSPPRIALLQGNQWTDVPSVPDPNPNNPYISATFNRTGTYAVYMAP